MAVLSVLDELELRRLKPMQRFEVIDAGQMSFVTLVEVVLKLLCIQCFWWICVARSKDAR